MNCVCITNMCVFMYLCISVVIYVFSILPKGRQAASITDRCSAACDFKIISHMLTTLFAIYVVMVIIIILKIKMVTGALC